MDTILALFEFHPSPLLDFKPFSSCFLRTHTVYSVLFIEGGLTFSLWMPCARPGSLFFHCPSFQHSGILRVCNRVFSFPDVPFPASPVFCFSALSLQFADLWPLIALLTIVGLSLSLLLRELSWLFPPPRTIPLLQFR